MVLRIKPTPTWFPTNSLYTPMGFAFHIKCVLPVGVLLLLLLSEISESSIAQEERPATSPQFVARFHLPHAIVMRFHAH